MTSVVRPALLAVILGLVGTAFLPSVLQAQEGVSVKGYEQTLTVPAGKFVQDLGNTAIAVVANQSLTHEQRSDKFREILQTSFDLPTIARYVIGRTWNSASPDQQKEYMRLFEELVVKTYGDRMTLYTGEGFRVTSARAEDEIQRDWMVTSEITHPDGSAPTEIDWRIRNRDGKLGVIDVVVEGISLSITQKQEYASIIQRNGGQIDGLLEQMRQQIRATETAAHQPG